jgi:hypothetical protein
MDAKEIVITLAGVCAGFCIALAAVLRYLILNERFPWQKKGKNK